MFGHCIQYGNGKDFNFFGDTFFKMIYSFHMPLFALVSGYLFFGSASRKNLRELFFGQVKFLVIPAMCWPLINRIIKLLSKLLLGESIEGLGLDINLLRSVLSSIWFLWAMFWCSLVVIMVRKLFHDRIFFYVLIWCMLPFAPNVFFIPAEHFFMYPYFAAGYLWRRENLDEKFNMLTKNKKFFAGSCAIILWGIMLQFFNYKFYIYTTGTRIIMYRQMTILFSQLYIDLFRWVIGFAGSAAVLLVLKTIQPVKFITLTGVHSLGIYVISGHIQQIVLKFFPEHGRYVLNFIEAVIITFVCYWLSVLISKNKTLNKFLLGGR